MVNVMKSQFLEVMKNIALVSISGSVCYGLWLVLLIINALGLPPVYSTVLPASIVVAILVLGVAFGLFLQGIYIAVFQWES